ncbi:MAG: preprotein translocase subunit YajC [Acidobacteriota bacterium]
MNLSAIVALLLAQAPEGARPGFPSVDLIMFGTIALIFYFLLIAPARKQRKQQNEMLSQIKNGDKVVTNGGIHGKIAGVTDQIVQLRIADGVKIEINKSAISSRLSD